MADNLRPFRFGIQTGPFTDAAQLRDFARKLEDLGYAELYSSDHTAGGGLAQVDPFLPLMVAAEATTTLRFGPLVLNNEFHNPVLLARTAATFDALSGGRLILGMGTGYQQSEHDAAGIPLRPPGRRVTRFEESLTVLRQLLTDGSAHLDGDEVSVAVDGLGVAPVQKPPPILIGGHGRRVVSLAGRVADIFQFTGLTHDPTTGSPAPGGFTIDHIALRHQWLTESMADRHRPGPELSTLVQATVVGDGAEEARQATAERTGLGLDTIDSTPFFLFGSTQQVIDKLEGLRERFGIHHVVSRDPDDLAPVVEALSGH
jgi:probable F420-dependent oxidoreductase